MNEQPIEISFEVEASFRQDLPLERIEEEVGQLRGDLREIPVCSITPLSRSAPSGDKTAAAQDSAKFLIAIAPELVKQALSIMLDWIRRDSSRAIKIRQTKGGPEYVITGPWKAADLAELMRVLAKQERVESHAS